MGYDGCDFELVDEDTLVSLQGAYITLWNTTNNSKDYIQCPRQNGYAQICTSTNNSLIAATEYGLQPECHIYHSTSKRVMAQFPLQTTLKTIAMSFCRDASYLLIVGGTPDFTISIYDLKANKYVRTPTTKLPFSYKIMKQAAFNPRNKEQFCILSDAKVYFFTMKAAFKIEDNGQQQAEDEEPAPIELNEIYRFEITEFSAADVPSQDGNPVAFTSFKWDMWNRVHICTNQTQILQVSSHDTPVLEQAFDVSGVPLTTVVTQKHMIVSTDDGLITWYRIEPPYENADGKVDGSLCLKLLPQIAYEYDFQEQIPEESRCPAFYMKYSKSHKNILIGTQNGILAKLAVEAEQLNEEEEEDDGQKEKLKKVLEVPLQLLGRFHTAPISGIRELDSSTQFITISEDHTMAIWEATNQKQLSLITLTDRPVALSVSASGRSAFVGTENGAFLIYDVTNRSRPRLVKQMRFFEEQVVLDHIVASLNGNIIMLASSASDRIFVLSQKAKDDFTIYGFLQMKGLVLSVSFAQKENDLWAAAVLSNNLIQVAKLPTEKEENRLIAVPNERTHTAFRKVDRGTNMIITSSLTTRIMVTGEDKYLKQYDLWPQDSYEMLDWRKPPIQPNEEYISHSIGTKCYNFSLTLKKMATGGKDGLVIVRDPNNIRQAKEFQTHGVVGGGIQSVCLSSKLPFFFAAGVDGSIFVVAIDDGQKYPKLPVNAPADSGEIALMQTVHPLRVEDMKLFTDVMQEEFEHANAEKKQVFKKRMMEQLGVIQSKLKDLLHENNNVTEIEKLERDEFVIDVTKQHQFVQEGENVCKDIRNEADKTNLRLELLRERVIDQTWNKMETQSKAIKSIEGDTLLFNFGVRKKTEKEQKILNILINQRKIELTSKYNRVEKQLREALDMRDFSSMQEGYFMNRTAGKPEFMTDESIALAAAEFTAKYEKKLAEKNAKELSKQTTVGGKGEEGKRKPYLKLTKGRLGTKIRKKDDGGDANATNKGFAERDIIGMEEIHWKVVYLERELEDIKKALESPNIYDLLYDSFEMYTDQRKRSQIELIREIVFELKRDYNKEFDQLESFKHEQIYAIKERNEQIIELQQNLKHAEDVTVPEAHELENPNHIFEVNEDEIKVEKYLTKEEKARLDEAEAKRLAREALLKGDNVGQRGLKTMMGGELVFKKDKSQQDQELVREDWMSKKDEEMNEDEKQRYKDFLQKEKEFKEKQRKAWEFALKNVRNEIDEIALKFEERVLQMYKKRLFYEHRIYEQELYIIRLIIMMHEVHETRSNSNKYTDELENIKQQFEERRVFLMNCNDQLSEFGKQIQNDQAEKKQDSALIEYCAREQLGKKDYINFLRSGKPQARVQVLPEQRAEMTRHIEVLDPFSGIDHQMVKEKIKILELKEVYDYDRDRPGIVVREQFDEIVRQRYERIKIDKTKEVNNKRLNNLKDFVKYLEVDVNQLLEKQDVLQNKETKTKSRVEKLKYNFEVIIYLKQGQVEVPQLPVATDYKDAILVQQSVVNEENKQIKKRGDDKVSNMIQILQFETRLKQVKNENKRLKLQIVDFEERAKDVQLYRVTKQTQEIIQGKHVKKEEDDKKRLDVQTAQLKLNCEKRVDAIKVMQSKLRREIKEKQQENEQLEAKARQLQINVEQRQQIEGLKSGTTNNSDSDPRKKAKDVANQRKLLDVIKQQEEEIMFLKDELDRLRARTFPSFAHLQGKQEHPDQR